MSLARTAFAAVALLALTTLPALAVSNLTARSSGVQAVHTGPGSFYPAIGKLRDQERVHVLQCTYEQRWCEVAQLTGGLDGWVPGSYLIGSGAKNAVSPFEFSFDPLDPLDLFARHR